MPTYNEEKTVVASIGSALRELRALDDVLSGHEVIVVNDGSDDKTGQLVSENYGDHPHVKLLSNQKNRGKGAAVTEGVAHARCSHTLIQDADLEYSPKDYRRLLSPVLLHGADVVYGSRFKGGGGEGAVLLALHGQPIFDFFVQHILQPQSDGYGDVLQTGADGSFPKHGAGIETLRH